MIYVLHLLALTNIFQTRGRLPLNNYKLQILFSMFVILKTTEILFSTKNWQPEYNDLSSLLLSRNGTLNISYR